jgi:hypothetical protein
MPNRLRLLMFLLLLVAPAARAQQQPAERVDPEWLKPQPPKRIFYTGHGADQGA